MSISTSKKISKKMADLAIAMTVFAILTSSFFFFKVAYIIIILTGIIAIIGFVMAIISVNDSKKGKNTNEKQ